MSLEINRFLDEKMENFFPNDGSWSSSCFLKDNALSKPNLICHLRDNNWIADFIIREYNLDYFNKNSIMNYLNTSEFFKELRHQYEQKVVEWQIAWMYNGGENWIVDENLGGELYMFSTKCDYAFRKGIVDTLSAIGMNLEAIEEGIEKNSNKWRENYIRLAFYNLYSSPKYNLYGNNKKTLDEPSQEHYKKWLKLRLYEYYNNHKNSVEKYGVVLPEMKMTDTEVVELKEWLDEAHEKRMKQIVEYKNIDFSPDFPEMSEIDYYGCDILPVEELYSNKSNKKQNITKLDFKTWLYLYITKAVKIEHIPIVEVAEKRKMNVTDSSKNEVYIFKNYDEYRNFYLMYLNDIDDEVIDLAIYTKGSKGQIVALKGLCERIIVKKKMNDFYNSITQKQIEEIHAKGKLTPLEAVQLWESFDLCIEGNKSIQSKSRCNYFEYNCHECMMETASHQLEYDNIELELSNDNSLKKELKRIK